jgi:hypothetical protein
MDTEKNPKEITIHSDPAKADGKVDHDHVPLAELPKGRWDRSWPVIACGAGLFSDGYLNGVIGSVSTMLRIIYGDTYWKSSARSAVPSIAFAGTVVGHLFFGVLSDHWSRRNSLLISTISMWECYGWREEADQASIDPVLYPLRRSIRRRRKRSWPLRGPLSISLLNWSWNRRRIVCITVDVLISS